MESRSLPARKIGKNKIIVILGPTASGKSDVAIRLARKFNGEIISADSRQIYRGMNIGTGKVSKKEQKMAKHWMIDITSPRTDYNVAKFKKDANYVINYVIKRNKLPIICGGTGFWIKAIVNDMDFPEVKPDWNLRKKLEKKSVEKLFEMLKKLDPKRSKTIDAKNKVRLIRAIEIAKKLGSVPKIKTKNKKYEFLQIGIDIKKEDLYKRIEKRLEKRFKQGMIKEIKKLHDNGISWKRLESFGLEYRRISEYLQNKISKEEMKELLFNDIKNYSKRQITWFKKEKEIIWLKKYKDIEKEAKLFLN